MHIFLMVFALVLGINAEAQSLTIKVTGIRNTKGWLQVAIFENEQQFRDETPWKKLYFEKTDISEGCKNIKIDLKPGTYAITVLDDEDRSKDMTFKYYVYPVEGVGFSNYQLHGMTKPAFKDFDFAMGQTNEVVNVKIKYFKQEASSD